MNALRWSLRVLVPLLILALGALGAKQLIAMRVDAVAAPPDAHRPTVGVTIVEAHPLSLVVRAQGSVVPRTQSQLVAEVAGRVAWVSPALASGGFFEADEELLRLDARDYELAVVQADLERARAERTLLEVEADNIPNSEKD